MATYKVRNKRTGEVMEVGADKLPTLGLSAPSLPMGATPTPTMPKPPSVLSSEATMGDGSLPIQTPPKNITGHSIEEHAQAINRAKMAGDKDAVKNITEEYNREYNYQKDFVKPGKESAEKKMKDDEPKNQVSGVLKTVLSRLDAVPQDARGPITGRLATKIPGMSADAVQYEKLRQGLAGTLKDLVGETGVLTDRDIDRITNLLPAVSGTPEEIELSKQDLKSFLQTKGISLEDIGIDSTVPGLKTASQTSGMDVSEAVYRPPQKPLQSTMDQLQPMAKKALSVMPGVQLLDPEVRGKIDKLADFVVGDLKAYGKERMDRGKAAADKGEVGEQIINSIESGIPLLQMFNIRGEEGEGIIDDEASAAAIELGLILITPKILEKAGKVLRPFKTLGEQRASVAKASEAVIKGDELILKVSDKLKNVSPTDARAVSKYLDDAFNLYQKKKLSMTDALDLLHQANQAFTASGTVGKSSKAAFNKALGDTLREEFKVIAPEITKFNGKFAKLYKLQDAAKSILKPIPVAIATAIGTGAAMNAVGMGRGGQ